MTDSTKGNLAKEVLDFLSEQKRPKSIRCQCGVNFQTPDMLCDSCGEIVIPE